MTDFYCIRVIDGRYQVGITTTGCDFIALPRAAFGNPRDAIRYAEMRQANVSPLRPSDEGSGVPVPEPSAKRLTALHLSPDVHRALGTGEPPARSTAGLG